MHPVLLVGGPVLGRASRRADRGSRWARVRGRSAPRRNRSRTLGRAGEQAGSGGRVGEVEAIGSDHVAEPRLHTRVRHGGAQRGEQAGGARGERRVQGSVVRQRTDVHEYVQEGTVAQLRDQRVEGGSGRFAGDPGMASHSASVPRVAGAPATSRAPSMASAAKPPPVEFGVVPVWLRSNVFRSSRPWRRAACPGQRRARERWRGLRCARYRNGRRTPPRARQAVHRNSWSARSAAIVADPAPLGNLDRAATVRMRSARARARRFTRPPLVGTGCWACSACAWQLGRNEGEHG